MAYVILKYDDLSVENFDSFNKVAMHNLALGVHSSFGLIGSSLVDCDSGYIDTLRYWNCHDIEIWNHGYYHTDKEFSVAPLENQIFSLTETQKLIKEKLGFTAVTWGSPHNNSTETTIHALIQHCPEITNYLFAVDASELSHAQKLLIRCNFETKPGKPDFEHFLNNYELLKDYPFFILQGHPSFWNESDFDIHNQIIDFLLREGHAFVTPKELSTLPLNETVDIDASSLLSSIIDNLENQHFSIYGAGEIARELYKYLATCELYPINFIVSDNQEIITESLCNVPVVHLSDFIPDSSIILLGLLSATHPAVIPGISSLNAKYIPVNAGTSYDKMINYIRLAIHSTTS